MKKKAEDVSAGILGNKKKNIASGPNDDKTYDADLIPADFGAAELHGKGIAKLLRFESLGDKSIKESETWGDLR